MSSWGLAWKRASEIFHLSLSYGKDDLEPISENPSRSSSTSPCSSPSGSGSVSPSSKLNSVSLDQLMGFRIELDWTTGDDEDQMALRLQSQIMVALPLPQDAVEVKLTAKHADVEVDMKVVKRREPLRAVLLTKSVVSGQQNDGTGVLIRLLRSNLTTSTPATGVGKVRCGDHWKSITLLSLSGCGLAVMPVELIRLPLLEKLYLDNNRLTVLPPEIGELTTLKVLSVDYNMLVSVPVELRQCIGLEELSLEHNKLVRPLLDLRAMSELKILRLFGNPLEFLPEILPLRQLRHLSLANTRIVADEYLRSVSVQIEMENSSYFAASKHKLSAFFSLIFRFSSCHHPLLASALAKIMQDQENRVVVSKDENAERQLISMISSDNLHVVEQACSALSSLAADTSVAMQLMKCDIMQPIETVLRFLVPEAVISVLQVLASMAFASDTVSQKMLTKEVIKSLKLLCANKNPEVQRLALLAVGNLAFCLENRRILVTSESLRELLMRLTFAPVPCVHIAAARALAILGENETLRRAIKARPVPKQGLRILSMDGGGMKGLATVQILKEIEKGTGKRIHELFDLICGTSTGGMLAVALGIKLMSLDQCEEIYKNLGKLVFAEPVPKENEAATWRDKLDLLYKSSSQSYRVVVHGSKHSAEHFERLLKELCADDDGDLLIESATKNIPKVFVVSTLVSVMPAQPFLFRNYQYPAGTPEITLPISESGIASLIDGGQVCYKRSAFIGSSRHQVWQAIRASSAAPYYLDDFSDDVNRWQDGAIVANNPTIFAIREAQLLWPDTKIDCLVSIGCGSVPTKARKGGWRYLDTGQVLIESACSVDRVEEALSALLPMLSEIHYFRFNPVDERCDMELDETDPAVWLKLEAAFEEYIQNNSEAIKNACQRLQLPYQLDEKLEVKLKSHHLSNCNVSTPGGSGPSLGWRHSVLLVEALHSPDSVKLAPHARALKSFCSQNGIRLSSMQGISSSTVSVASSPTSFSPPDVGRTDVLSPLSLDESLSGKTSLSPSKSSDSRQLSSLVQSLKEKLQNSQQVGIVHLSLQNDSLGSILCWKNDVFVVAEPGEHADKFLQSVKCSLLPVSYSHHRTGAAVLAKISNISDLVAFRPCFLLGGIVHRYMGRQTQVMEDDKEIGAYMFRRTVPSEHLTPDDVRWMPGAWKDRIIIYTGTHGPAPGLIKAFIDSDAKAVICPLAQPQEMQKTPSPRSAETNNSEFESGLEEVEEREELSPMSDWEDSDAERSRSSRSVSVSRDGDDEEDDLPQFVCQLYDSLFREGAEVDVSLRKALASHPKLRYSCHSPTV